MHGGMPYGRNQGQGQGQGRSREVDRQSPTGLIFIYIYYFSKIGCYFPHTLSSLSFFRSSHVISPFNETSK